MKRNPDILLHELCGCSWLQCGVMLGMGPGSYREHTWLRGEQGLPFKVLSHAHIIPFSLTLLSFWASCLPSVVISSQTCSWARPWWPWSHTSPFPRKASGHTPHPPHLGLLRGPGP